MTYYAHAAPTFITNLMLSLDLLRLFLFEFHVYDLFSCAIKSILLLCNLSIVVMSVLTLVCLQPSAGESRMVKLLN